MYCLTNFCCVCLKKDEHLLNLNTLDEDNIPIINKMIFVAFGHERLDVNISKLICNNCLIELNIAYKFKTKCLMSNELILGYNYQLKYFSGSNNEFSDLKISLDKSSVDNKPKKEILKHAKCEFCPLKFKNNIAKKHHQFRVHGKQIFCKFCCKRSPNFQLLHRHFFDAHFDFTNLFCKICDQTYASKYSLKKHLLRIHKIEIFFCNDCNTKFGIKELYLKHKAWHEKSKRNSNIDKTEMPKLTPEIVEKPIEMPQLTPEIVEKPPETKEKPLKPIQIKEKLKIVTRYLVCNQCDQIFVTSIQLTEHLKTHLMATEIVTFPEETNENETCFRIENVTTLQENGNNNDETIEEDGNRPSCESINENMQRESIFENIPNTNFIDMVITDNINNIMDYDL